MNDTDYITATRRTDAPQGGGYATDGALAGRLGQHAALLHYALGIVTEAGEIADALKKALIYGKELDEVNLLEEVGDLQWYEARLLDTLGFTFAQARERNIAKLRLRYPDGFSERDATVRDLDAERALVAGQVPPCGHPTCIGFMGCVWEARRRMGVVEPEPYRIQPTGFAEAPPHYAGEREAIDVLRDEFGNEAFSIGCLWNARKYEMRAGRKGDPTGDAEKARWYRQMAAHVQGYGADPRESRPDFKPYERAKASREIVSDTMRMANIGRAVIRRIGSWDAMPEVMRHACAEDVMGWIDDVCSVADKDRRDLDRLRGLCASAVELLLDIGAAGQCGGGVVWNNDALERKWTEDGLGVDVEARHLASQIAKVIAPKDGGA